MSKERSEWKIHLPSEGGEHQGQASRKKRWRSVERKRERRESRERERERKGVEKWAGRRPQGVRATSVPPYFGKINNLFGGVGENLRREAIARHRRTRWHESQVCVVKYVRECPGANVEGVSLPLERWLTLADVRRVTGTTPECPGTCGKPLLGTASCLQCPCRVSILSLEREWLDFRETRKKRILLPRNTYYYWHDPFHCPNLPRPNLSGSTTDSSDV